MNARVIHVRMEERVKMDARNTHVIVQVDTAVIIATQVGLVVFYLVSNMLINIFMN